MSPQRAIAVTAFAALLFGFKLASSSFAASPASGLENIARTQNVDLPACKIIVGSAAAPATADDVIGMFNPSSGGRTWQVRVPDDAAPAVSFLIAFREPIEIGSVQFGGSVQMLRVLKSGAPYPPDLSKAGDWQAIAVPPNQLGAAIVTMPPDTRTRALVLTDPHPWRSARLEYVRLMSARVANITPAARAYAESEYTQQSSAAPPHTYAAALVTQGGGAWQNTGKDSQAHIPRVPISNLDPAWFILSWDEPQTIRGIWSIDDFEQVRIETYNGPKELNPRAGTDAEWDTIKELTTLANPNRLVSFPPVTTRGIRLTILKSKDDRIARIDGLHVLASIEGNVAVPVAAVAEAHVPPPLTIPYKMESDGEATLVINGPDGRRVRNIFAREPRAKGDYQAGWDLKDEQGRIVPQGTYQWKMLTHPPLALKYEMTAYPNVSENSPENPPWITSMGGPGGWLADHTSNLSGAASGEFVFFGAPVSESGVSFICCDLTGRKLWAVSSFGGFTGAYHIAAEGKTAYVSAPGGNMGMDTRAELVWAVDVNTHQVREIARLLPTSKRQRGIQSMAVRGGKLHIAVSAVEDWFASAAGPDDVDIERCSPHYAAARKPRFDYEVPPNPRDDFLRLFRLTGQPAGGHALTYIESTPGKSPRRHVAILFNRPIPIGSAIYPQPQDPNIKVKLSLLKEDAPYPPNPGDPKQWTPFVTQGKLPWDVATAPPNARARALRITFTRGDTTEDDLLGADDSAEFKVGVESGEGLKLKDKDAEKNDPTAGLTSGPGGSWIGQLEGLKIISHRFENVAGSATIAVNSGTVDATGNWDAKRNRALSESDPGIYALKWKEPHSLRGLALKEVDGRRTEVDVYTGPADSAIDIAASTGWKHVGTYFQERRVTYWPDPRGNAKAIYLDGYVDFGSEITTRAVRLRVCEQWQDTGQGHIGPRFDVDEKKWIDSTRCRVFGVAAMKYIGGDGNAVDPLAFQRIETLNAETGKIEAEVPLPKAVAMAFSPQGMLDAICGQDVMTVDLSTGKHVPLITGDLLHPQAFAIDKAGNLYIYDQAAERKNIRVYSPAGKFLRTIGTPGGYRAGPWDPTRFENVTALVIDAKDQLWAVDNTYYPKRISLWSIDGSWKKDFLGNTAYGGGGVLDPKDKTRLFYGPLEFALDWKTGHSHLKNLTWIGDSRAGEEPIYVNGRNYMVTRFDPPGPHQDCGVVYLYEKDHLRRVAAVGHAASFPPLTKPELQAPLGNPALYDSNFVWTDLNGDGEVQANEVIIERRRDDERPINRFNHDLGIQSQSVRFHVTHFLPDGVPVYEIQRMPGLRGLGNLYRLDDGNFQGLNAGANALYTPDGKPIWTYPNEGSNVQALTTAKPYSPEQVVCEFSWVGHDTAHTGDLGEFFVMHTNVGVWNIWSADGLLAGSIFGDLRVPGVRGWNMPEHSRGMSLDNVTPGQEHFNGSFCRTADNHYYAVAGHNHVSVVEVVGIDRFKRLSGSIEITPADVAKNEAWAQTQQRQKVYQRTPVLDCYRVETPIPIDGKTGKWDTVAAEFGERQYGQVGHGAVLHAAWDTQYLYLCYDVRNLGPLRNSGEQWDRLFKSGASVDLQLGADPAAPRDRKAPVAGDKRLLLTFLGEKPTAVLYDAVVPGTSPNSAWKAVSPVAQVSFDRVAALSNIKMACVTSDNSYVLEAAIPLEALGIKPVDDLRLKIDWGALSTDASGNSVMQRIYWSNGATAIIADVPSEARLHPDLWGYVIFHDRSRHIDAPSHSLPGKDSDSPTATKKRSAKDIERELNGEK